MTKTVYYASEDRLFGRTSSLKHAWSAAQQREAYDKRKRHERYERDKQAGKIDLVNKEARTENPNGNYANPYYDPEKAQKYYQETYKRQTTHKGSSGWKTRGAGASSGGGEVEGETDKERELRESKERQQALIDESNARQKSVVDAITEKQKSEIDTISNTQNQQRQDQP